MCSPPFLTRGFRKRTGLSHWKESHGIPTLSLAKWSQILPKNSDVKDVFGECWRLWSPAFPRKPGPGSLNPSEQLVPRWIPSSTKRPEALGPGKLFLAKRDILSSYKSGQAGSENTYIFSEKPPPFFFKGHFSGMFQEIGLFLVFVPRKPKKLGNSTSQNCTQWFLVWQL